jgi:hypothetical protein
LHVSSSFRYGLLDPYNVNVPQIYGISVEI